MRTYFSRHTRGTNIDSSYFLDEESIGSGDPIDVDSAAGIVGVMKTEYEDIQLLTSAEQLKQGNRPALSTMRFEEDMLEGFHDQEPKAPVLDESDSSLQSFNLKNDKEYFSGASKRRIRAKIRNGIAPEEAYRQVRELVEKRKLDDSETITATATKRSGTVGCLPEQVSEKVQRVEQPKCTFTTVESFTKPVHKNNEFAQRKQVEGQSPVLNPTPSTSKDSFVNEGPKEAAIDESLQTLKVNKNYEYFSGASKRRIRALIDSGIEPEEARRQVRERVEQRKLDDSKFISATATEQFSTNVRRLEQPNSAITTFLTATRKIEPVQKTNEFAQRKQAEGQGVNTNPIPSTSKDSLSQSKVAIMHSLHPKFSLAEEQLQQIKAAILDEVDNIEGDGPYPQFIAQNQKAGWLSITCNNQQTRDWIFWVVPTLKPWPTAQLKVMDGSDAPKNNVCVAYVPPGVELSGDKFLLRIGKQNPSLNTSTWRMLHVMKAQSGGQTFVFSVDDASVEDLIKIRCRPFLNFSEIQVKIKGNRAGQESTEQARTRTQHRTPPKSSTRTFPATYSGGGGYWSSQ